MYCYSINNFDCPDGLPICVRDTHQDPVSLLHRHDYLEIALVRLGHGIHTLHNDDGGKLESSIIKGDVFTILSGEAHSYRRCRDFRVYNICIAWSYWERIAAKLEFLEYYKKPYDYIRRLVYRFNRTKDDFLFIRNSDQEVFKLYYVD